MAISLRLLISDYERARASGDSYQADKILKQIEKSGALDYQKTRKSPNQNVSKSKEVKRQGKIDPGRF